MSNGRKITVTLTQAEAMALACACDVRLVADSDVKTFTRAVDKIARQLNAVKGEK